MSGDNIFFLKQVYICNLWLSWSTKLFCYARTRAWNLKKIPSHLLVTIEGQMVAKCKMQSPDRTRTETQIRASFIGIVVQLVELNMFKTCLKHPAVTAAWDSRSEQMFLKGFEMLLVCILITILLHGNF